MGFIKKTLILLQVALIVLKMTGYIIYPWAAVMAPIIAYIALTAVCTLAPMILMYLIIKR